MKAVYVSPVFTNENGEARQVFVPLAALSTYVKRDKALMAMIALGGIDATPTAEFISHRKNMMAAKRKILRNGWASTAVV